MLQRLPDEAEPREEELPEADGEEDRHVSLPQDLPSGVAGRPGPRSLVRLFVYVLISYRLGTSR